MFLPPLLEIVLWRILVSLKKGDSILSHNKEDEVLKQNLTLQPFLPLIRPGQKIKEEDYLKVLLIYLGNKVSLLPELAEVLPVDKILLFLNVFSGQRLNIPEKSVIEEGLKDISIYFSLSLNPTTDEVMRLARQYKLTPQTIRGVVEKISNLIDKPNPLKNQ